MTRSSGTQREGGGREGWKRAGTVGAVSSSLLFVPPRPVSLMRYTVLTDGETGRTSFLLNPVDPTLNPFFLL